MFRSTCPAFRSRLLAAITAILCSLFSILTSAEQKILIVGSDHSNACRARTEESTRSCCGKITFRRSRCVQIYAYCTGTTFQTNENRTYIQSPIISSSARGQLVVRRAGSSFCCHQKYHGTVLINRTGPVWISFNYFYGTALYCTIHY